jgi:hypothetical protein
MADDDRYASIRSHAIGIRAGLGAAPLIAILIACMLIELPPLRPLLLAGGLGVIFGLARAAWRRGDPLSPARGDAPVRLGLSACDAENHGDVDEPLRVRAEPLLQS